MEAQLIDDVNTILNLETKINTMTVNGVLANGIKKPVNETISKIPWAKYMKDSLYPQAYTKSFNLQIDLRNSKLKIPDQQMEMAYDNFCLVPNFQFCNIARFYYVRVSITLQKNEVIVVNIPIEVEK